MYKRRLRDLIYTGKGVIVCRATTYKHPVNRLRRPKWFYFYQAISDIFNSKTLLHVVSM